jgi:hypothetical protein
MSSQDAGQFSCPLGLHVSHVVCHTCYMSTYTAEQAAAIATETRRQIEIGVLMSLGAHDIMRDGAALTFKARIAPKGFTKPRIMRVTITLTPFDLYHVKVIWQRTKFADIETHAEMDHLDTRQLNRYLLSLDS